MDFHLPELGEGIYEAELVAWKVRVGDEVRRGQSLMEVMTDKATMEVPSPFAGTVATLSGEPGQPIKVGDVVLTYTPREGNGAPEKAPVAQAKAETKAVSPSARRPVAPPTPLSVKAAPSVRYLARQLGIDLTRIPGSGPGGRILLDDLSARIQAEEKPRPAEPKPDFGKPGTRIKLVGVRRKVAEHMVHSKRTVPHYGYVDECDVTEMVRLRQAIRDPLNEQGVKLTYLAFFVKAVVAALKEVPLVNASLDESAGEIVLHDRYHVGIATATPGGLIVPVIHDADRKDLAHIARDIERLSNDARANRVKLDDLRGGTFTITSIGGIGGLISTPIINHPEVGILGIGKVVKRPVYDDAGNLRPADIAYLSFSFDHRVLDGAVGAAFGNAVIRQLQNAAAMLLPVTNPKENSHEN